MITSKAYEKFIIKINKNATTDSVACDKGKFTVIINEVQNRFQESILDRKFEDDIRYIQHLLVEKVIPSSEIQPTYNLIDLPKDYFDLSNTFAYASNGICTNQKIDLFEIKSDDQNSILRDEFSKPSFKYREAPYYLLSDKIKVFKEDFDIESVNLSYYRYPLQIKLVNESDPESDFDTVSYLEWDDKSADRIISLAASEFELNNNSDKFQANKINAVQKI
jgi:hypothetical protein